MRSRLLLATLAAGLLPAGCRHCCGSSGGSRPADRLGPPTRPSGIPPQSLPTVPPSSVPSMPVGPAGPTLPPPNLSDDSRSSFRLGEPVSPPVGTPEPEPPAREILLPDALPGAAATAPPARRSWLGEPVRPPDAARTEPERVAEKPTADAAGRPPAGFQRVAGRDGLATGRVPDAGELDWLAGNGFRTVLLVHDAKAGPGDLSAAAERRNLRLVPVAADPADLGAAYEGFARAVGDKGGRPVYVADADPARAGALWYTLFRRQELAGDEIARLRARPLGLDPAGSGPWWAAAQELAAKP